MGRNGETRWGGGRDSGVGSAEGHKSERGRAPQTTEVRCRGPQSEDSWYETTRVVRPLVGRDVRLLADAESCWVSPGPRRKALREVELRALG